MKINSRILLKYQPFCFVWIDGRIWKKAKWWIWEERVKSEILWTKEKRIKNERNEWRIYKVYEWWVLLMVFFNK